MTCLRKLKHAATKYANAVSSHYEVFLTVAIECIYSDSDLLISYTHMHIQYSIRTKAVNL